MVTSDKRLSKSVRGRLGECKRRDKREDDGQRFHDASAFSDRVGASSSYPDLNKRKG
jgi:hypothetical protein